LIPAEFDVFVNVSPYAYNRGSSGQSMENGYVQIGVTHLTTKPADLELDDGTPDGTWTVIDRLEALEGTVEIETVPIDEDATDVE